MKKIVIKDIEDIERSAKVFLNQFSEPSVVAFVGEMGAGKTTFIKAICKELEVLDTVNSPTFAIVNEYETQNSKSIYHFDLYRIKKSEEVLDIGFEDYLYSGNWCFIEWPEIAEQYLPEQVAKVKIEEKESGQRELTFMAL